ncbi:HVM36 protein, partial [Polypterus senegalus]
MPDSAIEAGPQFRKNTSLGELPTLKEILQAIKQMKDNTTCSLDVISANIFKAGDSKCSVTLTQSESQEVVSSGSITLSCQAAGFDVNSYWMVWIRQTPGKALEWLASIASTCEKGAKRVQKRKHSADNVLRIIAESDSDFSESDFIDSDQEIEQESEKPASADQTPANAAPAVLLPFEHLRAANASTARFTWDKLSDIDPLRDDLATGLHKTAWLAVGHDRSPAAVLQGALS